MRLNPQHAHSMRNRIKPDAVLVIGPIRSRVHPTTKGHPTSRDRPAPHGVSRRVSSFVRPSPTRETPTYRANHPPMHLSDVNGLGTPPPTDFLTRVRVRYCECDPMGVAHHASYIPWLEIGRTELLRQSGMSYAQLEEAGVLLVIVKLDVRYRRSVRYDDVVEIHTTVKPGSRVKIEHSYEVRVTERLGRGTNELAAVASTTLACVDREGKIRELPDFLVVRESKP